MQSEMVLIVAGDEPIARRIADQLSERDIRWHMVEPRRQATDRKSMFEIAFESGTTGILLVEALPRGGGPAPPLDPALVNAARAASKAPDVTFFAWVTPRPEDDPELAELRRCGTPYGIIRPAPVLDLAAAPDGEPRPNQPTLVRRELADALADAGALFADDVAMEVASWIEQEQVREGRTATLRSSGRPLENYLTAQGLRPLVVPGWRLELNAFFGMTIVEGDDADGLLRVARRPLRRSRGPRTQRPSAPATAVVV